LPIKWLRCWRFDNRISEFWAHFHFACIEMVIYELLVKGLTSPFASATRIFCDSIITLLSEYIFTTFWRFPYSTCAEIALILLPVWKLPSPSCSATMISYEGDKMVAIWQQYKRVLCIFSQRIRRNSYLVASGKKSDPAIRSSDVDFL